jgi:hypothetical protein
MRIHFHSAILLGFLLLESCKPNSPETTKTTSFSDIAEARQDFERIAYIADEIFWRATDRCMRDSGSGMSQVPKQEFLSVHENKITNLVEVTNRGNRAFVGTAKIFSSDSPDEWFEMEFESSGREWVSRDCKLIMKGHEMNYFDGHFLSQTNLKHYVDEAITHVLKDRMARNAGEATSDPGPTPVPAEAE